MPKYNTKDDLFPDEAPQAERSSKTKANKKVSPTKAVGVLNKAEAASILAEVKLKAAEASIAASQQKHIDTTLRLKELNTLLERFSALLD